MILNIFALQPYASISHLLAAPQSSMSTPTNGTPNNVFNKLSPLSTKPASSALSCPTQISPVHLKTETTPSPNLSNHLLSNLVGSLNTSANYPLTLGTLSNPSFGVATRPPASWEVNPTNQPNIPKGNCSGVLKRKSPADSVASFAPKSIKSELEKSPLSGFKVAKSSTGGGGGGGGGGEGNTSYRHRCKFCKKVSVFYK